MNTLPPRCACSRCRALAAARCRQWQLIALGAGIILIGLTSILLHL